MYPVVQLYVAAAGSCEGWVPGSVVVVEVVIDVFIFTVYVEATQDEVEDFTNILYVPFGISDGAEKVIYVPALEISGIILLAVLDIVDVDRPTLFPV